MYATCPHNNNKNTYNNYNNDDVFLAEKKKRKLLGIIQPSNILIEVCITLTLNFYKSYCAYQFILTRAKWILRT